MERDVRYITVGIAVILTTIGFFLFVVWLAQGTEGGAAKHYDIYFQGSISGLDGGSEVQYHGVEVGRVLAIDVLKDRPEFVRVRIQVAPETPINRSTVATSRAVGFTGLAYVGLHTEKADAPPARQPPGEPYPVIDSRPSRFEQVFETLPKVMERMRSIAKRADNLLGGDTQRSIEAILDNTRQLTANLNRQTEELSGLMERMKGTLSGMDKTFAGTRRTLADTRRLVNQAEATMENLDSLSGRLDRFTAKHQGDFDQFAGEGLEEMRLFLEEGRATLKEIRELSRRLKENPSQLIYRPGAEGVEIPQ